MTKEKAWNIQKDEEIVDRADIWGHITMFLSFSLDFYKLYLLTETDFLTF